MLDELDKAVGLVSRLRERKKKTIRYHHHSSLRRKRPDKQTHEKLMVAPADPH